MTILADIGALALWLMYGWLFCAYVAGYLTERKGYGLKLGLGLGMLLVVIGVVVALLMPAREGSDWRVLGPVGRGKKQGA
jgi:fucose permease